MVHIFSMMTALAVAVPKIKFIW